MIQFVAMWEKTAIAMVCGALLIGCDDSDDQEVGAQDIPTSISRPAPRPEMESLHVRSSASEMVPTKLSTTPHYELYSKYQGQDIRQITGVSGRTLWLCFTAPWCPHCADMIRELQKLAQSEKGNVQVVDLNADEYPAIAEQFHITKVPTTVLYTEGVRLRTIEGAYNADSLRRYLHRILTRNDDVQTSSSNAALPPDP